MKRIYIAGVLLISLLAFGCATKVKFPVSDNVPAADIKAKIKNNDNGYDISIKAKHLADPERLSPPKTVYVVWLVTEDNQRQNLGVLELNSSKESELNAISPFKPNRFVITAEETAEVKSPGAHIIVQSEVSK